jgi:hypothetical protein
MGILGKKRKNFGDDFPPLPPLRPIWPIHTERLGDTLGNLVIVFYGLYEELD